MSRKHYVKQLQRMIWLLVTLSFVVFYWATLIIPRSSGSFGRVWSFVSFCVSNVFAVSWTAYWIVRNLKASQRLRVWKTALFGLLGSFFIILVFDVVTNPQWIPWIASEFSESFFSGIDLVFWIIESAAVLVIFNIVPLHMLITYLVIMLIYHYAPHAFAPKEAGVEP